MSYDPVDVLAEFADREAISYPLLADVGSIVITKIGLINNTIVEDQAYWGKSVNDRHKGLPYPGSFFLDEEGFVTEKLFERSHRIRPGGKVLLDRLGLSSESDDVLAVEGPALAVAIWVDSTEYFPNQVNRLNLKMQIEEGFHVYVPPNPEQFVDFSVVIEPVQGLFTRDYTVPEGRSFSVSGFDERFNVVEREMMISIPFYAEEGTGEINLRGRISYQACTDATCLAPDSVDFEIRLRELKA